METDKMSNIKNITCNIKYENYVLYDISLEFLNL